MKWEELDPKQKTLIIVVVSIALILLFTFFKPKEVSTSGPLFSKDESEKEQLSELFYVEITGMVNNPGVYELDKKLLVIELIEIAGGIKSDADLEYIHQTLGLSSYVESSQKIFIPATNLSSNSVPRISKKISINNSSMEELIQLAGVGEATANKIIEGRPYQSLDELKNVSGIGESTYNKIVTLISL